MIVRLNNSHRKVYDAIRKHGKAITCIELHEMLKVNILSLTQYLATLKKEGFIKDTSRGRKNYYTVTTSDYDELKAEIVKRNEAFQEAQAQDGIGVEELEDPLLEACHTYQLNDDQWNYIRANPTLSRREIAKRFGVHRTVLLAAIDKRKVREKVVKV